MNNDIKQQMLKYYAEQVRAFEEKQYNYSICDIIKQLENNNTNYAKELMNKHDELREEHNLSDEEIFDEDIFDGSSYDETLDDESDDESDEDSPVYKSFDEFIKNYEKDNNFDIESHHITKLIYKGEDLTNIDTKYDLWTWFIIINYSYTGLHTYPIRELFISQFGYVILDQNALDCLSYIINLNNPFGRVMDIGSGNGYLSYLLSRLGLDVISVDSNNSTKTDYKLWYPILIAEAENIIENSFDDHCLFFSWTYTNDILVDCLNKYRGDLVIVIGECGGCTGCLCEYCMEEYYGEPTNDKLNDKWEMIAVINIPTWDGINDRMRIYIRKNSKLFDKVDVGSMDNYIKTSNKLWRKRDYRCKIDKFIQRL
jgi:hypothetical protein